MVTDVASTGVKQNTTLNSYHPRASIKVPWDRVKACKTQYKCCIDSIPWHHLWYPDVTSMRVKCGTNVELIPSLAVTSGTLMSPQHVQNTIQTLTEYHHPSPSLITPWRRLNVCETQCKCWMYTTPRHQSWHLGVASTREKHHTHVESSPAIMVPRCHLNSCKTQYTHSIYTIPPR